MTIAKKFFTCAAVLTLFCASTASAAPLPGFFNVVAVNVTNVSSAESEARLENLQAALQKANNEPGADFGGADTVATWDIFTYDGLLDFSVGGSQDADYTIAQWLGTGTGMVDGLETINNLQLSRSDIDDDTAETTFFLFSLADAQPMDLIITHDDGVAVFDGLDEIGFNRGPTSKATTTVNGFDGGELNFLYVATNGNPSIFQVDATMTPVPLPAGLPLLAGALGLLGWRARRRAA